MPAQTEKCTVGEDAGLTGARMEIDYLVDSLPAILISLSPSWKVTRWNAKAEEVLGIAAAEAAGRTLCADSVPWDWEKVALGLERCRCELASVRIDDIAFKRPDGKDGYLGMTVNAVVDGGGQCLGFTVMGADVTERKALMSQLQQSQKLKSIGQLAAGIAHEINTPTQYVGDNTRFLQEAFEDLFLVLNSYGRLLADVKSGEVSDETIREIDGCLEEMDFGYLVEEIPAAIAHTLEGVERISKIVRAMKEFSHPGREEKVPLDINKAIESTITVARNEWKYVAEMQVDFDQALPPVPCMPGEFNQVILNMIINAAHAIADVIAQKPGGKGLIRIRTARVGNTAQILISDTGTGIPPEIRARIFDPFFTTKEVGRGTGQGLAICYPVIVEKHGGAIEVESQVGRGTDFTIRLPLEPGRG